jgi:hypothetical protein
MGHEHEKHFQFTGPLRLARDFNTLKGIVDGISADGTVSSSEIALLTEWVRTHQEFANRHPFSEVYPAISGALADGVFDKEELFDIGWLCTKLARGNDHMVGVKADLQTLQGMMGGIIADCEVTLAELEGLHKWVESHEHLRGSWPYDEVVSLLTSVLADHKVDIAEQASLLAFFNEFTDVTGPKAASTTMVDLTVTGVCATCPEIVFPQKVFSFTGESERCSRDEFAEIVSARGGMFKNNVTQSLDYLVVGSQGSPCWAFACYGRKIEAAVELRKKGLKIAIVHENDFWDAVN